MKNNLLRRLTPIVAAGAISLAALVGCNSPGSSTPPTPTPTPTQPTLGPISVTNSITPTTILSGTGYNWTITVYNPSSGEVMLNAVNSQDKCIGGWRLGYNSALVTLPLAADSYRIPANTTKTVYTKTGFLYNDSTDADKLTDLVWETTVTAYSNGGNDSSTATYTVKHK